MTGVAHFMYSKNVLDVDCQTQGRLKFLTDLYFDEKYHCHIIEFFK
jgi:hypothetical protein